MNVKELREKLAKLADETHVVVYWEDGAHQQYFGIDDVTLTRGTPRKNAKGKPGFVFEQSGSSAWLFISISPEE